MTTMRICGREANCGNRQSRGCPCGEKVKDETASQACEVAISRPNTPDVGTNTTDVIQGPQIAISEDMA